MKRSIVGLVILMFAIEITPLSAQNHMSMWVNHNSTDTTVVPCWNDSLTRIFFPPSSMNMMMPSSMYMRIDKMRLDNLTIPHDSIFLCWYRIMAGTDSLHFDLMNMYGGTLMMQFIMPLGHQFHWDSMMTDSHHRKWRPTGMMGWDGISWTRMSGTSFSKNIVSFYTTQVYSAVAFTGTNSTTSVSNQMERPTVFSLEQNFPNPFNPSTDIGFSLQQASNVTLEVYDVLGRVIQTLINSEQPAGDHKVHFDGGKLSSGIYFYRLQAGSFNDVKKMQLMK